MEAVHTNCYKVTLNGKEYTVIGQYARHGEEKAKVVYYLLREDNPDFAIKCGSTTAAAHYLNNSFSAMWFWADIQNYGCLMAEKYENEIVKYRKVG